MKACLSNEGGGFLPSVEMTGGGDGFLPSVEMTGAETDFFLRSK